jgi:hypothetical protein
MRLAEEVDMSMRVCERCSGFIPSATAPCPHCRGNSPSALRVAALTLGATFALAAFVPGCAYGCPDGTCEAPVPDASTLPDTVLHWDAAPPEPDAAPVVPDAAPAAE